MKKFNLAFVLAVPLLAMLAMAAIRPSLAAQVFTAVTCSTLTACVSGNNNDSGPGVQGTSALGKGVVGQTKFNSTSSTNGEAGVFGQDLSTNGVHDNGVSGKSVRGSGVLGTSSSAAGVLAVSTSGSGVFATSSTGSGIKASSTSATGSGAGVQAIASGSGPGVFAQSANGPGLSVLSTNGFGINAQSTNSDGVNSTSPNAVGVIGSGDVGVEGNDSSGTRTPGARDVFFADGFGGHLFRANNTSAVDVFTIFDSGETQIIGQTTGLNAFLVRTSGGYAVQANNTTLAGSIAFRANSIGGLEFVGNGSSGNDNFVVDDAGNVHAHSFTPDLPSTTPTSNGSAISTYSPEVRAPTIEDFGEATLRVGHAYVRLDPAFAGALARGVLYLVFITPMGPTRGSLYVSQRTASGFYVHESGAAASTVAFDYRIVGKRYMAAVPRVPITLHAPKIVPTIVRHPKRTRPLPVPIR